MNDAFTQARGAGCASQSVDGIDEHSRHALDILEVVADHGLRAGVSESTVVNAVRPQVVDGVPCRGGHRRDDEEHHRGEGEKETRYSSSGGHGVLWVVRGLLQGMVNNELWH